MLLSLGYYNVQKRSLLLSGNHRKEIINFWGYVASLSCSTRHETLFSCHLRYFKSFLNSFFFPLFLFLRAGAVAKPSLSQRGAQSVNPEMITWTQTKSCCLNQLSHWEAPLFLFFFSIFKMTFLTEVIAVAGGKNVVWLGKTCYVSAVSFKNVSLWNHLNGPQK